MIVVVLLIALVAGICGAILAGRKQRYSLGWFLLCFLFWPAVFFILCLGPKAQAEEKSALNWNTGGKSVVPAKDKGSWAPVIFWGLMLVVIIVVAMS